MLYSNLWKQSAIMKRLHVILIIAVLYPTFVFCKYHVGVQRSKCDAAGRTKIQIRDGDIDNPIHRRLAQLRNHMQTKVSVVGPEIDAYIITSFDEHLNNFIQEFDERHFFISGFTGKVATIVVTMKSVALWTDERFISLANEELDCDWHIFNLEESPTVAEWLGQELHSEARIGADPKLVPHATWAAWEKNLSKEGLSLIQIKNNLIDLIWTSNRPEPRKYSIKVHPQTYSGEKWQSKLQRLRKALLSYEVDAMVVTSLTEIAYLLNLRGHDIPHIPVFKGYMIVTPHEAYLYTNKAKITLGIELHLKLKECSENCIHLKNYGNIFDDIRTFSQRWRRVLVPAPSTFDHGASEAIYSAFHHGMVVDKVSPVIYMRAQKNEIEKEGMRRAHVRDAAAICDAFAYLEQKFIHGDTFTELTFAEKIDSIRVVDSSLSTGTSLPTTVAFGSHAGHPYYIPSDRSNAEITDSNLILIESGGQYLDGTTDVSRTIHLGEPSQEEKKIYTNVLIGLIRLSMLQFPENMRPAGIDTIARGPQWGLGNDYPHGTGHGIGCYSSVYESPINIAYNNPNKHPFKEGYFFTAEPGYYRPGYFGVRLENVLEVIDTGKSHPNGEKFLALRDVTLVPFEPKLIDIALMSAPEKKWLNDYNARIREEVGKYLKETNLTEAFFWMMNKTQHVIEYLPESEYKGSGVSRITSTLITLGLISMLLLLKLRTLI